MDVKKNGEGQKILRIDLFQAVAIFAGAVITTAVVTAFGLVNIATGDHFKILANETAIKEIKTELVNINTKLDYIIDLHIQK